jgi:hypothetical protein
MAGGGDPCGRPICVMSGRRVLYRRNERIVVTHGEGAHKCRPYNIFITMTT